MKKNKNAKYSLIAISILIIVLAFLYIFPNKSPLNNPESFWLAGNNPVLGDGIHISKERNNIKNDTLFRDQIPIAVILKLENRFWSSDRILTIKNIKTQEIGTYYEK